MTENTGDTKFLVRNPLTGKASTVHHNLYRIHNTDQNYMGDWVHNADPKNVLGEGSEGIVVREGVIVNRGEHERAIKLAFKVLPSSDKITELVETYTVAKKAGLRVPQTYRATEGGILMTDFEQNGRNVVLSSPDMSIQKVTMLIKTKPELMRHFGRLDIESIKNSEEELSELEKAARASIMFDAEDVWFLVLGKDYPDGIVIVSDFREVVPGNGDYETVFAKNVACFNSFCDGLIYGQNLTNARLGTK